MPEIQLDGLAGLVVEDQDRVVVGGCGSKGSRGHNRQITGGDLRLAREGGKCLG